MKDETKNSKALLIEAIHAFEHSFPHQTLGVILEEALRARIGLSAPSAREFSLCLDALVQKTITAKPKGDTKMPRLSSTRLVAATEELNSLVEVDIAYDIPALAGYAKDNPRHIYLDRGLILRHTLASGRHINVAPYLVLHEVVEKLLLDVAQFSERAYQRTHQIAQRLEQAAIEASGISWQEYQYDIMEPEINKAYKRASMPPPDLDVRPYIYGGKEDLEILATLTSNTRPFFTSSLPMPHLYHLEFANAERMAEALMRFEEFYESPQFKGTYFTREEFEAWYAERTHGSTYAQDWAEGFNIPSSALVPFYDGHFDPLTADEQAVLNHFKGVKNIRFYIIATAGNTPLRTLKHEIAHALYFLNPAYRQEVDSVLATANLEPLKHFLVKQFSDYHEAVLDDEAHAYLGQSSQELEEHGFSTAPYDSLIKKLQDIYAIHALKSV